MGLPRLRKIPEKHEARGALAALEICQREWMRVRIELSELKRTGSQQGLADLKSEAVKLSMQIKRLENLLRLQRQTF
jgi:hypothetical protein